MHLKGNISWEGFFYSCCYLVPIVSTDVTKHHQMRHKSHTNILSIWQIRKNSQNLQNRVLCSGMSKHMDCKN